jgi:hypothetical protein
LARATRLAPSRAFVGLRIAGAVAALRAACRLRSCTGRGAHGLSRPDDGAKRVAQVGQWAPRRGRWNFRARAAAARREVRSSA